MIFEKYLDKTPSICYNTESMTKYDENHKNTYTKSLSEFNKITVSKESINKYKSKAKYLKHVRTDDNTVGYLYIDKNDNPVAVITVSLFSYSGKKWIQALEVSKEYQGYGLSKQLLDVACLELGAVGLSVHKNNKLAKKIYEDYGFKMSNDGTNDYEFMYKESYVKEDSNLSNFRWYHLEPIRSGFNPKYPEIWDESQYDHSIDEAIENAGWIRNKLEERGKIDVHAYTMSDNCDPVYLGRLSVYVTTDDTINWEWAETSGISTKMLDYYRDEQPKIYSEAATIKFNSDKELYDFMMKNVSYEHNGTYDTRKIEKDYKGDCHDQAGYIHEQLKKLGYKTGRIFMVEYSTWNKPGGATHTACWYVKNNKYCWMETAWGGMEGIHECGDSLNSVENFICKNWHFSGNNTYLYIGKVRKVKNGMSLGEYVEACTPEKTPITPYTKGRVINSESAMNEAFSKESHDDYAINGTISYAEEEYRHFKDTYPTKISPYYIPSFDLPSNLNIKLLEDEMDIHGKKIVSKMNRYAYIKGDYPFKFYTTVHFTSQYLSMMDKLMKDIPLKVRFSFKVYQHNFQRDNRRYSMLIVATKTEVIAVYYLYNAEPTEIPIKRLNLMESTVMESDDELEMPDEENTTKVDAWTLLDNTDPKRVFLSSDWHFFKHHYKREANYVNTRKIVQWCRKHIKDNDVFMYLGDISFRYANSVDKEESAKIMKSIPGIKILILGNHDIMAGYEYYTSCGFDYVFESLEWQNYIFTHKPIPMEGYPGHDMWNIHGHIHNLTEYNTTDGQRNVNVYPMFYDNKPVTLQYIMDHKEELIKHNKKSNWVAIGESFRNSTSSLTTVRQLVEASNTSVVTPTVLYSPEITSDNIARMVQYFEYNLKGNVAIKLHVGEEGNQNWLSPRLLKQTVKMTRGTFVDSNVLYDSIKQTTEGHMKVAEDHGFTAVANFDVLDQEGGMELGIPGYARIEKYLHSLKDGDVSVISEGPHLNHITVGSHLERYDSMIVYTHFKGHTMAGFGGSIKNIGMGIPSGKVGKLEVHRDGFKWGPDFLERLVESASAIQDYFDENIVYVNVLANISTKCDCEADAPKSKMPNIGVLVSNDIVAIEQASIDFIRNCKNNKEVMEVISSRGGMHQIEYAEWLGLGQRNYKLYDTSNNRIKLESSYITEMKRSNLPDSAFGIPEDRKYPLDTAQHVKSAIKLFGHAEESKKKALAQRIKSAATKYDITIPETTQCYKYLSEAAMNSIIPPEVKNIVFDMGDVLVYGDTKQYIENDSDIPNEYADTLYDVLCHKILYPEKKGRIFMYTLDEAIDLFKSYLPDHMKQYVPLCLRHFNRALRMFDYTDDLITMFRSKGYKVYYLSNWDKYTYDLEENFFAPLLSKLDGGVFSFEVGKEKPDKRIYDIFLSKYNLVAEECMFFDDKQENVDGAKAVGMHAILFDKNTTAYDLLGGSNISLNAVENMFLADNDGDVETVNIDDLTWWYIAGIKHPSYIDEELYYKTIDEAIKAYTNDEEFESCNDVQKYVFTCNGDRDCEDALKFVPLGKISINKDRSYKWLIQYPLQIKNGKLGTKLEWAMASCNPAQGIAKPFILKVGSEYGGTIDTTQYVFSPDIISDKYLVVNEDAKLELVDSKYFDERYVEEYEFVGNKYLLKKIAEAYKNQITVDNSFFYATLTGRHMLSEDQIDFDRDFKKVDFELMKEKQLSEAATRRDAILAAMGRGISKLPIEETFILENVPFMNKYNTHDDFCIKQDFDGYYFYNKLNGKRSASVAISSMMTEAMIRSIL